MKKDFVQLKEIRKMEIMIENKKQELKKLNETMVAVNISNYEEKVQSTHNNDRLSDLISDIVKLQDEINNDIDKLLKFRQKCMRMIDSINNPMIVAIAYKRYFEFKKFEEIADEMNISVRWVLKLNKTLMNM